MSIDLSVPIWTIEHVAAALHLSEDTARQHTYLSSFPAPRAGFNRNLWLREQVLAWFAELPAAESRGPRSPQRTTAARVRAEQTTPATERPAGAPRPYTPRAR